MASNRNFSRAAAKTVASGDRFWDKRKMASKAGKRAAAIELAGASNPGAHRLTRKQKQWMENHLSTWSWAGSNDVLQAPPAATPEQIRYIAERAPQTMLFILVDPRAKSQQTIRLPRLGSPKQRRSGRAPRSSIHPHSAKIITEMISRNS